MDPFYSRGAICDLFAKPQLWEVEGVAEGNGNEVQNGKAEGMGWDPTPTQARLDHNEAQISFHGPGIDPECPKTYPSEETSQPGGCLLDGLYRIGLGQEGVGLKAKQKDKTQYSTFEICKKFGIKYGRLREWIDRGYIVPSIERAEGAGTRNVFSPGDVYRIRVFRMLIDMGLGRDVAGKMSREADMEDPVTIFGDNYSISIDKDSL